MKKAIRRIANLHALVVAGALAVTSGTAAAAAMLVNDPTLNFTQLLSQSEAVAQYAKQVAGMAKDAAHYKAVYQKYQQELIKLQRMVTGLKMGGENAPTTREEDWNTGRCGGAGFSVGSVLSKISLNKDGNIIAQQQDICRWIQVVENRKYNLTVEMISEVKSETTKALNQAASRLDGDKSNGGMDTSSNDLLSVGTQLEAVHKNYAANIQAYDAQISALKSAQVALAEQALRGERGPLGTLVKTGALQGALKVGN